MEGGSNAPADGVIPNASEPPRQPRGGSDLPKSACEKRILMPTATLNLTVVSKRMLTKREAAEHCGRPLKMFDLECPVTPVKFANGDLRWDVRDLDAWLDTLKAGIDDVDTIVDRLG
jgi:hypothetical protein